MRDPETGYDDTPICECRPCKLCLGEGAAWNGFYQIDSICPTCHGTGTDSSRCEVHAAPAGDAK